MEIYRLSKQRYQHDLSGTGAFLSGGRWNSKGTPVLYTAHSRSLALVESLVHLSSVQHLEDYLILVIYAPDDVSIENINYPRLSPGWTQNPSLTQGIGDQWVESGRSLLLRVPSAVVANEYNYLLNPAHPEAARVRIVHQEPFLFDSRLK